MGMRIQGGSYSAAEQMQWQQRRQNFEALSQAISGGNLSSANDAFAKIKSQMPGGGANLSPDSFLGKIGAALQSGDLSTAQQLLASRQNQQGGQTASSTSSSDAVTAANAAVAADAASAAGSMTAGHGRHHHGGGGKSPALELSQAIQSGDTSTAQSSMQTIVTDLQQLSSLANPTGSASSGSGYNSVASSAASAAQKLLQNPDFQALQDAVANGDASGMQTAWTNLISGSAAQSSAATAAATSSTAQQQVAA